MANSGKISKSTRSGAVFLRALLAFALCAAVTAPVLAQGFGERFPFFERQRPQSPGFFPFFGPGPSREQRQRTAPAVDYSRAPTPEKKDAAAQPPAANIVVLGDSMADWLAYGLEEILSERPEIGVVRKHRSQSGLIRYDAKDDTQNWAKVAREILAGEKANAVVMVIGLHDRIPIREPEKRDEKKPKAGSDQPNIAAPERSRAHARKSHEFKSDEWAERYSKLVDETIAALKTRAVPVFWVGLPPVRGARSTSDMAFFNDLFRARAEKAGITYVDVWDGFVNEQSKYVVYGPDFEGQRRRLRSGDGVHFTKAGALKFAHYVEREIRRVMGNRLVPVALPTQDESAPVAATAPGQPAPRPLAGPVVPLTAAPTDSRELLGAGGVRPPRSDPIATRVLRKGEAAPHAEGRADDFAWPRPDATAAKPTAVEAVVEPAKATPAAPAKSSPAPARKKPTAAAEPPPARAANGRTVARRNAGTVAGQPVLRPPGLIPNAGAR
jgi:hypothetical protein